MVKQNGNRSSINPGRSDQYLFPVHMWIYLFIALTINSSYTHGLTCWTCRNARSNENCLNQGRLRRCNTYQASCQNELRRDGSGMLITKTCKQLQACTNRLNYGDLVELTPVSCTVHQRKGTVCRCCCTENLCNKNALYCTNTKPTAEDQTLLTREASKPVFLRKMCYLQTNPVNGWVRCSNENNVRSVCRFGCHQGFALEGESRRTVCTYYGRWTEPAPSCRRSVCGSNPSAPENGVIICGRNPQNTRICRYSCKQGYQLVGDSVSTCKRQGQDGFKWDPAPICKRVDECSIKDPCINGGICVNRDTSYECQCPQGFTGQHCEEAIPQCPGRPNAPENGKMTCSNSTYLGSRCVFVCDRGYRQSGKRVSTCQYFGMDGPYWSNLSPTLCRVPKQPCPTPAPAPNNGLIACSNENNAGSVCEYICFAEYQLIGEATSQCLSVNGVSAWTNNQPRLCEKTPPAACLEEPTPPLNGYQECTGDSTGSICNFYCDGGFILQGPSFVTCVYNEEGILNWKSLIQQPTECIEIDLDCSQLLTTPENGELGCTDGRNEGSVCYFSCREGFNLLGASVVSCERFGNQVKWNYSEPIICEEMVPSALCAFLPTIPDNGNMMCSDEAYIGSTCVFYCNDGYFLIGEEETTCRNSQVVPADWSSPPPVCLEILPKANINQCPDLDTLVPPNGKALCSDENQVGSFCQIICDEGYEISGFSDIACESNLVWSTGLPKPACLEIEPEPESCPDINSTLLVPMNGYAICSEDSTVGSICEVSCEEGYQLLGTSMFACEQESGETPAWSNGIPPMCDVELPPPI